MLPLVSSTPATTGYSLGAIPARFTRQARHALGNVMLSVARIAARAVV